ncbi:MAG TPA: hypothetical protein VFY23_16035, partial [Candidatus Limnocylindrales bacterium]|nr:hypothetical protein [Candidatus Limnocylindrales bacterium]
MIHRDAEQLLAAGAALDDLEADERVAYEAHRRGCAQCAVLEDELSMVLADLSLVVPERVPPADLFAGIRLAIDAEDRRAAGGSPIVAAPSPARAEPALVPPAAAPRDNVVPIAAARSSRRPVYAVVGLAAVFAFAAVGLGAQTAGLQDELDQSQAQVAQLRSEMALQGGAMAAAMNPSHVTVALESEPLAEG